MSKSKYLSERVYYKILPPVSHQYILSVKQDSEDGFTVKFRWPIPIKESPDIFVTECKGTLWDDLLNAFKSFDFSSPLFPVGWEYLLREYKDAEYKLYNLENKPNTESLPETYVFDEEQSVKWNREKVREHNDNVKNEKDKALKEAESRLNAVIAKIYREIQADLYGKVSTEQAKTIFDYANSKSEDLRGSLGLAIQFVGKLLNVEVRELY